MALVKAAAAIDTSAERAMLDSTGVVRSCNGCGASVTIFGKGFRNKPNHAPNCPALWAREQLKAAAVRP